MIFKEKVIKRAQRQNDNSNLLGFAAGFGLVAGAVAGLTFRAMGWLQDTIWDNASQAWQVAGIIMLGGCLVAVLQYWLASFDESKARYSARQLHWRRVGVIAVLAVISVGFGGAIGPEAGLVAVVVELAALVKLGLARYKIKQETLEQWGRAAALGGLYISPLAGAAYEQGDLALSRRQTVVAAMAGFVGFVVVCWLVGHGHGLVIELPGAADLTPNLYGLLGAGAAALAAAALSVGYLWLKSYATKAVKKFNNKRRYQAAISTLLLSGVFAVIAALQPLVLFSGHHQFSELAALVSHNQYGLLALIGLLKLIACAVCLSAGWRGGDAFPLMFGGAAVGLAMAAILPGVSIGYLAVAGMAAGLTVGLKKPIAALLLVICIVAGQGMLAACVGVIVGMASLQLIRTPSDAHSHA